MRPTGGYAPPKWVYTWLKAGSIKAASSRPTHQRVTQTVRRIIMQSCLFNFIQKPRRIKSLLFSAVIVLGLAGCIPLSELSYTEPTPVLVSHTAEELNGLTQLWSRDDVYELSNGDDKETLDASISTACFIGDLGKPQQYDQLICFNDETGEVKWKGVKVLAGLLTATPVGLFVADLGGSVSGFSGLSDFDLLNGALIWRKDFINSNPTSLAFFDNQVQLITWKPGQRLWVFDTNGNILKVINDTHAFLTTPEVTFFSGTGIRAERTDTGDVLWDHIDTSFTFTPIFTQDKIFCHSQSYSETAYALDRNTGKVLWRVQDLVDGSSLAYSPEKRRVYALRKDGALLAIDEDTGEINIAAKFSSPLFLPIIDGTAEAYELAYDQEQHILLVSFGDGHQLFAFREE